MIEIKTYSKPKKTGGSGGSSSPTKYISGVISEAEHAGRADKAKRAEVADQANYAGTAASAQNAAYASEAGNLHADAEILQKYLSKDTVDPQVVKGMVIFAKGLIAKGLADLMMGAKFGNNAKITELGEAFFSTIKSLDYDNAAEQGFSVEKDKNGKYHAFFTNLTIWGKAIFHELEVRKLSYSGGNIYLSGAGSKLIKVVPVRRIVNETYDYEWMECSEKICDGWKCYLLADDGTTATMNDWQEGDQVRCQTMGEIVSGGTYQNASNKSYWRTIPDGGVSTQNEKIYGTKTETYLDEDGNEQTRDVQVELYDGQAFAWIVIGKHSENFDGYTEDSAPAETKDIPAEGDTIVLDGNRHRNKQGEYDKTDRQNVIILETTGKYAPRIACYANITEYKHTFTKRVNGSDKEVSLSVFETSPKAGTKINSSRFEWISDDGSTINIINYRGDWDRNNTYHKNDQVNHNNAVWVCVANSGVDVTEEPRDGVSNWKKVLSGGKGEKGDKGEDGLSGNGIVPAYIRSKDNPTPPTSTDKNNLDSGWSLVIPSVGDVKNVSYSDSSWTDYNDSGYTWKKSPTTADGSTSSCLVTFTTTKENQVVKFVIKSFSEPRYDYIFLSEIDAASAPSRPTSNGWYRAVSGNGVELSVIDIIATAGTHTVYVCYGKDNSSSFHGDYGLFRIEKMTDIDIPLWQSNGKEVFTRDDSGAIKSEIESWSEPFKVTGENGTDAVSYTVTLTRGSNGTTQGLYVGVTRYIGTACTTGTIIDFGMSCKAYTDGTLAEGLTDRLQTSDNYIDFAAFPEAKSFTVELLDKNGNKVATGNYSSGDDAYRVEVSPSTLIFDTDDNGRVTSLSGKTATIRVYQGNKDVSNQFSKYDINPSNKYNCNGRLKDLNKHPFEIQVTNIEMQDVTTDGQESTIPKTNGFLEFILTNDSATVTAHVDVQVNVAKFTGQMVNTNKRFSKTLQEISTRVDDKVGSSELTQFKAEINQTAREISLSVSEKSIGRRNLLVGSAFRRQGEVSYIVDSHPYFIRMNDGYGGTNCAYMSKSGMTQNVWCGAMWNPVTVKPNTKYTFSMMLKVMSVCDEGFDVQFIDVTYNSSNSVSFDTLAAADKMETFGWTLKKITITTPSLCTKLRIDAFIRRNGTAYMCRPMLEEGENYNGWTLSEQDYEYVGGNILDNTRSLEKSGNLEKEESEIINEGYEYAYAVAHSNNTTSSQIEMLQWNVAGRINDGQDYMFSFLAKGTGMVNTYLWKDETPRFFVESSNNIHNYVSEDGDVYFELTKEWKRYWVHYHFNTSSGHTLPENLLIRCYRGNEVYICQPKLEIGATMTEFTERKTDLVDKATMKKAGIEITTNQIKLYGDKVQVLTRKDGNSEYVEAAMFVNGKLNAQLIDADKIEVKHLWAKSEDGATKVGYFGNTENMEACKVDNTYAPLFIGADNAKNAPFHVTQDGAIYALMGRIGKFTLTDNGIFEYDNGVGGTHKPMQLSENCIYFSHTTDHTTNDRIIWMGYTSHATPEYGVRNLLSDIWIDDREYQPDYSKACLVLSAEGGTSEQSNLFGEPTGNFAICASKGMYAGFRPMTRTINRSMELSELDCYIEVTAAVTLTLPKNPQRGQTYWIMRSVNKGVNTIVKGNGKKIYTPFGNGDTATFTTPNEIIWLTYIKDNWKAIYIKP